MKKKIIFGIFLALVILLVPMATASADSGGDIVITASEIDIDGDLLIGEEVTFSGTVTVDVSCTAEQWVYWWESASAYAEAGYNVGGISYSVDNYNEVIKALQGAEATATVTLDWTKTITFNTVGDYSVDHYGYGEWAIAHDPIYGWSVIDGDEETKAITRCFHIDRTYPELYFRLTALGADGSASYGSGTTSPIPTLNAIDCIGNFYTGDGKMYRFVVPTGTVITDVNGQKALCLYINGINGNVLSSTFREMTFSNPVQVYVGEGEFYRDEFNNWTGGNWLELGSFTEIVDGKATIE